MKRRVVNLVALLSLLLCVAAVALWVRSYWVGEMYWSGSAYVDDAGTLHRRFWRVTSGGGAVEVYCVGGSTPRREFERLFPVGREAEYGPIGDAERAVVGKELGGRMRLGLRRSPQDAMGYLRDPGGGPRLVWTGSSWRVALPLWLPAALAAVVPGAWGWHWYRTRRQRGRGRCTACGYDLRATPEKCPECGKVAGTTG